MARSKPNGPRGQRNKTAALALPAQHKPAEPLAPWRHSTATGGPSDNMKQRGTPSRAPQTVERYWRNPMTRSSPIPPKGKRRWKEDSAQAKDGRLTNGQRKALERARKALVKVERL